MTRENTLACVIAGYAATLLGAALYYRFILNRALVEDKHSDEQTEQFPDNDRHLEVFATMLNVYSWADCRRQAELALSATM